MNNPLGSNPTEEWHLREADLVAYADGELPARKLGKTQAHLRACWTCRTRLEGIQKTICAFVDFLDHNLTPSLEPPPRGWRTFQARLDRVVADSGKRPIVRRVFASLKGWFSTTTFTLRLATGLPLTTLVTLLALFLFNRIPQISANQVIHQAAEAQQRCINAVAQPVIHQKLRVRREGLGPVPDSAFTWEIWHDTFNDRFRERAEDANGQLILGPPSREGDLLDGRSQGGKTQRRNSGRPASHRLAESASSAPTLRELVQVLQANAMNPRRPLSAASYDSWRRSVPHAFEGVENTSLPDGRKAFVITTAALGPPAVNAIIKSALVVRTEDWHPVEEKLEVQGEEGVGNYDLTETGFEVLSLNNLSSPMFSDRPLPSPSVSIPRTVSKPPSISPTETESTASEINVAYALHRLRACMGESIDVLRDSTGHIEIRGVVESPERKEQLIASLQGIALVRANIQTVEEVSMAVSASPVSPGDSEKQDGETLPNQHTIVVAQDNELPLPIESQLREYFARLGGTGLAEQEGGAANAAVERQIAELSNQAVSLSLRTSAEASALRGLAERFPPARVKGLDPASKWLLEVMVRDHLAALRAQMAQYYALLGPISSSFGRQGIESSSRGDTSSSDSFDSMYSSWADGIIHVFPTVQRMESLTDYLFAGATESAGPEEAVAELFTDFTRLDHELQYLEAQVDEDFSGRLDLADTKGWARQPVTP